MTISDNNVRNVSNVAQNNPHTEFAGMSQLPINWSRSLPLWDSHAERGKWFDRENARWLIIRNSLRACAKKGIRDISHRMQLQGCPERMGLYDLLEYISKVWDPDRSTEVCDLQWLAGWDIEFCRATGDWSLVLFSLGLLQQAAVFHGQLPCAKQPAITLDAAISFQGFYTRVARAIGADPSHVRRVALGHRKSPRISAALAAEIARINQEVLSGNGAGATSNDSHPKPDRRAVSPSRKRRSKSFAPSPSPLPPYLTVNSVAEMLGVSLMTVLRFLREGKIKGYQLNNRGWWRIKPESVNSYLKNLEAAS